MGEIHWTGQRGWVGSTLLIMKKILSFFLAACLPAVALAQWPGQGITVRATNGFSRFQTLIDPTNNGIATFSGTISATSAFNANQFDTTGVIDIKNGSMLTNTVVWSPTNNWVSFFTNNSVGVGGLHFYISTNRVGGIASYDLNWGTFDGAGNFSTPGANFQITVQYDHNGLSSGAITDVRNTEGKLISGGSIALVTGNGNNGKDRVQIGTVSAAGTGSGTYVTFMRQITPTTTMPFGYSAAASWDSSWHNGSAVTTVSPSIMARVVRTNDTGLYSLSVIPDLDGPSGTGTDWNTNTAVQLFRFIMGMNTNGVFETPAAQFPTNAIEKWLPQLTAGAFTIVNSNTVPLIILTNPAAGALYTNQLVSWKASMHKVVTDSFNFITLHAITNYQFTQLRGFTGSAQEGTLTNLMPGFYTIGGNMSGTDTLGGRHILGIYTNDVVAGRTNALIHAANTSVSITIPDQVFWLPANTRIELKQSAESPATATDIFGASLNVEGW